MIEPSKKFISETLLPNYPPKVPLIKANWSGLAFDRNFHSDLAPANVWDALLSFEENSEVAVISFRDLEMEILPVLVRAGRESLMAYLTHDFRFTADHYVFSQEQNWICRLDQDVTLIAGETKLIQQLVNCCDGFESVMKIMSRDFYSGHNDECGLEQYLMNLTRGIINSA